MYSQDGKLKPGAHVSTFTDKPLTADNTANSLKSISDKYDDHITKFDQFTELQRNIIDKIDKSLLNFFGNLPVTTPKLTEIKIAIDNLTKLRSEYDVHVTQFGTLKKHFNRTDDAIDKLFGKRIIKPDDVKTDLVDIIVQLDEIIAINQRIEAINADSKTINDIIRDDLPIMVQILEKVFKNPSWDK